MFPVFIDSGRAYDLNFPSRKRRFQYVGRIQRALRPACSDQGMQLIDEKEDITVRRNFPDHGTDPLLKFAAELCPGNHPRQVEHDHTPVLHDFRDGLNCYPVRCTFFRTFPGASYYIRFLQYSNCL